MKQFWRALSLLFLLLAVWVGVSTVRTMQQGPHGGEPMDACAGIVPGIILLIAAGPPDDAETANPPEPEVNTPPQRPEDEA
jgi:hypothetical protein